jgi:hypothetical protein
MGKINIENQEIELRLKGIEILESFQSLPENKNLNLTNFSFNLSIDNRSESGSRIIFVLIDVKILTPDQSILLGGLKVNCIFEISNFDNVINSNSEGPNMIPKHVIEILNSISISTTRGILFSTYRGTFLHNAILPIIDPKDFTPK